MCQIFDLILSSSLSTMKRNFRRINFNRFWACFVRWFRFSIIKYINHADKFRLIIKLSFHIYILTQFNYLNQIFWLDSNTWVKSSDSTWYWSWIRIQFEFWRWNESSSTQKKESSIQTVIWLINWRANSHEKNKSSSDFRTTQKTAYWRKNRNWTLLCSKIAQRTTLFQRSRVFLIKSLSVLPFLDVQDNKLRSVVTILSEITRLLWYLKYKAIASSIFYQKE